MTISDKLSLLREKMKEKEISAFIVFSVDPHMSEYLPDQWKERTWISGFTGSAGFVVISLKKAALWTDGRYFVQAAKELENSEIDLMKDGIEGTPNYIDWIISQVPKGKKVAVNALATSHTIWTELITQLKTAEIDLINMPLLDDIWIDRGVPEKYPVFVHPIERAGKSVAQKLSDIRQKMNEVEATMHIISSLDDVAWTLNLRGSDVKCNPVFLGYIILTLDNALLFVDPDKLDIEARKQLNDVEVKVIPYEKFYPYLKTISGQKILISPTSNQFIFESLEHNNTFIKAPVPGNLMKAVKNETELNGFRTVMVRDGVAMVKFLYWLTHTAGKESLTEYSIGEKLATFRAQGKNFVGISFGTIVGYQQNAAIPHYSAKKEDSLEVTNEGIILVDSGGQYLEGTTDITRTLALGKVSDDFKTDYTLVLKGMIDLCMIKFSKGTRGNQLDAIARLPLWMNAKDFNHGTGHGVGSFMNVHEGPQSFRKDLNPTELQPGMVLSDEPGIYIENKYGIRHENLIAVVEAETNEFGVFYKFETLTFCPFFTNILKIELMTEPEINWLNAYHKKCEEKIGPYLEGDVKTWFLKLVKPI